MVWFWDRRKTAEARRSFEQALQFAPQFTAALEQLVNLDLSEGRFARRPAGASGDRAGAHQRDAAFVAGPRVSRANQPARRESTLLRARELNPTSSAVNALLARTYVLGTNMPPR